MNTVPLREPCAPCKKWFIGIRELDLTGSRPGSLTLVETREVPELDGPGAVSCRRKFYPAAPLIESSGAGGPEVETADSACQGKVLHVAPLVVEPLRKRLDGIRTVGKRADFRC